MITPYFHAHIPDGIFTQSEKMFVCVAFSYPDHGSWNELRKKGAFLSPVKTWFKYLELSLELKNPLGWEVKHLHET